MGTITPYRENTKDFDILWTLKDGTKEGFPNIDYTNLSRYYIPFADLDDDLNYKVKVITLSLNISDAINTCVTSSSTLKYYSILDHNLGMAKRGGFWQGFLWILGGVVTIVAVAVVPILIPALFSA